MASPFVLLNLVVKFLILCRFPSNVIIIAVGDEIFRPLQRPCSLKAKLVKSSDVNTQFNNQITKFNGKDDKILIQIAIIKVNINRH